MDRIRNFKHRLSLSVDKLTPSRRSRSPQAERKSTPLGTQLSEGSIPTSVQSSPSTLIPQHSSTVDNSSGKPQSRPASFVEGSVSSTSCDLDKYLSVPLNTLSQSEGIDTSPSSPVKEVRCKTPKRLISPSSPPAVSRVSPLVTQTDGADSLMTEVLKEVNKITNISDDLKYIKIENNINNCETVPNNGNEVLLKPEVINIVKSIDELCEPIKQINNRNEISVSESDISKTTDKYTVGIISTNVSTTSTLHAESVTSGYFSDSTLDVTISETNNSVTSIDDKDIKSVLPNNYTMSDSFIDGQSSQKTNPISSIIGKDEQSSQETNPIISSSGKSVESTQGINSITTATERVPEKKFSIYSRLVKSTKKDSASKEPKKESSSKEPIYAKIKPKLKLDMSFKPIEPNSPHTVETSPKVIKPEPVYSQIRPRDCTSPFIASSPIRSNCPGSPGTSFIAGISPGPGSPSSSFKPPRQTKSPEPPYSTVPLPKELPKSKVEPVYSKVKKRLSCSFPRDSDTTVSTKSPIYSQPLPSVPKTESGYGTTGRHERNQSSGSDYGKVTVHAKEISPTSPCRPSVITISNPGYSAPLSTAPLLPTTLPQSGTILNPSNMQPPGLTPSPTASPVCFEDATLSDSMHSPMTPSDSKSEYSSLPPSEQEEKTKYSSIPLSPELLESQILRPVCMRISSPSLDPSSTEVLNSCSSVVQGHDSDTESTGRTKLSRLVEELAQELENVSHDIGSPRINTEDSKKEVLSRLLATYDVPKNLKRVENADYAEIKQTEQNMVNTLQRIGSIDELRYVDDTDENFETVYADVPDYSQDEFFIALDDETDPKYASLTREMREKKRDTESPGKVSRKSAQVYVNVINVISALKVLVNSNSSKAQNVINKMGTLARPYAQKVGTTITDTSWIQRRIFHKSGHNGFDDLRRYIKSGGEFCKELSAIMHERADLEATYAKGLTKLSQKLLKASKESMGSISQAWQSVATELEAEGDTHKVLAGSLTEDVVRPMRQLIETQHKIRKGVESMVDKTTKNVHEWRAAENKAKKTCYHSCRDNEKIQDAMNESRLGRGKTLTEKEIIKLEKQRRKAEELVQKSDLDYYSYCIRAERARLEWESAIYKGSNCFQTLEEERLCALKDLVEKYHRTITTAAPKMLTCASDLDEPISQCDVEKDIQMVISVKGTGENVPEQMLPDFYAEDMNNIMNRDRRRDALDKFVKLIRTDLDRERRGKHGVENLAKALQETPNFGGEDSQQDVNDKLQHMKAMLAYLEAARYKVQNSLDELNNRPRSSHPLAKHIEVHRDKQGVPISILKVPPWVQGSSVDVSPASDSLQGSPNWNDRGTADGTSVQPDSDFDEFSSQGSDRDYQSEVTAEENTASGVGVTNDGTYFARPLTTVQASGRCKALYDYDANMYDELTIRTGDLINLYEKQPDGWWLGELDGVVGIFPATYVEEID